MMFDENDESLNNQLQNFQNVRLFIPIINQSEVTNVLAVSTQLAIVTR